MAHTFTVDRAGPPQRVRARAHFRDVDGGLRQVTKFSPSKAAAELALRDRVAPAQSGVTAETKVEVLGRRWLEGLPEERSTKARD